MPTIFANIRNLYENIRNFLIFRPRENFEKNQFGLNPKEIQIIQRTWNSIANKTELGQRIFRRIFIKNPNLKVKFQF